jgi:hypothetical protein
VAKGDKIKMSFIGSMLGGGSNFQAQSAPLQQVGAIGSGTQQAQNNINQQQALASALAGQNGIQNQSNVYSQLGNIASGQGPNPAQAMLAQQTGQNVANQSALMAGQRGASQNPGLIARQAGQQGASTQQQAVGQGATLQAQQALGALGQQANIAGQQVGNTLGAQQSVTNAQQAQNAQAIGANVAQNQANIQNASQQNAANAQIAAGQQQQQGNILGGVVGGIGSALGLAYGGVVPYADGGDITDFSNTFGGSGAGNGPSSSFGKFLAGSFGAGTNPFVSGGSAIGGAINQGVKAGFNALFGSSGPGTTSPDVQGATPTASITPSNTSVPLNVASTTEGAAPMGMGDDTGMAHGGKVPAALSPGEKYLPPGEVKKVADGKKSAINAGETIHGKAKVPGDSLKNDNVNKTLTEGGIVLPRSVTQSKNPGPAAQKFVEALISKQDKKKGKMAA